MKNGFGPFGIAAFAIIALVSAGRPSSACLYNLCSITEYGRIGKGSIEMILEVHGYSFSGEAGDIVLVRANRNSGNLDPRIRLFSPQGAVIAEAGIPETGRAEIIARRLPYEGGYTLVVSDLMGNGFGDYSFSIECTNRPGGATLIPYNSQTEEVIVERSEMKVYQFDGLAGEGITLHMMGAGGLNPRVQLFDPEGRLMADRSAYNYIRVGTLFLPVSGRYTVVVSDDWGDTTGSFTLLLIHLVTDADEDGGTGLPAAFAVEQNRPNPFNLRTSIAYTLPRAGVVSLTIYDILGRAVRTLVSGSMPAGQHTVEWDGRDGTGEEVGSGIYFYRLQGGEFSETRKMLLMK